MIVATALAAWLAAWLALCARAAGPDDTVTLLSMNTAAAVPAQGQAEDDAEDDTEDNTTAIPKGFLDNIEVNIVRHEEDCIAQADCNAEFMRNSGNVFTLLKSKVKYFYSLNWLKQGLGPVCTFKAGKNGFDGWQGWRELVIVSFSCAGEVTQCMDRGFFAGVVESCKTGPMKLVLKRPVWQEQGLHPNAPGFLLQLSQRTPGANPVLKVGANALTDGPDGYECEADNVWTMAHRFNNGASGPFSHIALMLDWVSTDKSKAKCNYTTIIETMQRNAVDEIFGLRRWFPGKEDFIRKEVERKAPGRLQPYMPFRLEVRVNDIPLQGVEAVRDFIRGARESKEAGDERRKVFPHSDFPATRPGKRKVVNSFRRRRELVLALLSYVSLPAGQSLWVDHHCQHFVADLWAYLTGETVGVYDEAMPARAAAKVAGAAAKTAGVPEGKAIANSARDNVMQVVDSVGALQLLMPRHVDWFWYGFSKNAAG